MGLSERRGAAHRSRRRLHLFRLADVLARIADGRCLGSPNSCDGTGTPPILSRWSREHGPHRTLTQKAALGRAEARRIHSKCSGTESDPFGLLERGRTMPNAPRVGRASSVPSAGSSWEGLRGTARLVDLKPAATTPSDVCGIESMACDNQEADRAAFDRADWGP